MTKLKQVGAQIWPLAVVRLTFMVLELCLLSGVVELTNPALWEQSAVTSLKPQDVKGFTLPTRLRRPGAHFLSLPT